VVLGDNNNWFAAWALWQMKSTYKDVRIMDGGRKKCWPKRAIWIPRRPNPRERDALQATGPDYSSRVLPQYSSAEIASRDDRRAHPRNQRRNFGASRIA